MNLIILFLFISSLIYSTIGTSEQIFAGDFKTPSPPEKIVSEYQASFIQHKWYATGVSHIVSGMIYANFGLQRLRMDVTYDETVASSLFDFENANADGTIPSYVYTIAPTIVSVGSCVHYNVTPTYPLLPPDILTESMATFTGLVTDNLFHSGQPLQTWTLSADGSSVTVFVDKSNTVVRIDFSAPGGTFTTTRLFNIVAGPPEDTLFEYLCPMDNIR